MPYSEEDFERMHRDPEFARQYFWTVAMNAKRRVFEARKKKFKSPDEVRDMEIDESFSATILENLDRLVASVFPHTLR